jgi:hypothetical protein
MARSCPLAPAAAVVVPAAIVSSTIWAASPAGLTGGVGGALVNSMPDATVADRPAAAAAAQKLPVITSVSPNTGPAGTNLHGLEANFTGAAGCRSDFGGDRSVDGFPLQR